MTDYFLDTWALIEILRKNPMYRAFSSGEDIVTTRLNLMEMAFQLLKRDIPPGPLYRMFLPRAVAPSDDTILRAMEFRRSHPEPGQPGRYRFSYIDAVGYTLAREQGLLFVTGDRDFRGLPGVEYLR